MEAIRNRYEFVIFFDCENGNPNGDPDAGNMPRVDAETSVGLVTDVCLKRKIRNFVETAAPSLVKPEEQDRFQILIRTDKALNEKFSDAYDACGLKKGEKGKKPASVAAARDYMCEHYFDVRTFGAVMSTGDDPCGIVRGPVQLNFGKSVDPVLPQEITITRQAVTTSTDKTEKNKETEMGKKNIIPYGLYRSEGYVSAMLAGKTGFSEEDLQILWKAILEMFEHDHSAARGKMCLRKLLVFKHDSALGNAPSQTLFDKVKAARRPGVEVARRYEDYDVTVDADLPDGVTLLELR